MATSYTIGSLTPWGCAVGDRIKLLHMGDDPCPMEAGATGTVIGFCDSPGLQQLVVAWDNGRGLNLVPGVDRFAVI